MTASNFDSVRQKYIDIAPEDLPGRWNIFQLKYDGWWCKIDIVNGLYSRTTDSGRIYESDVPLSTDLTSGCIIGEHMRGTQWSKRPQHLGLTYIYDVWSLHGENLTHLPYVDRYHRLLTASRSLPPSFVLAPCFLISEWSRFWTGVVCPGHYEGLVFRNSSDPVSSPIGRMKLEITETLTAVGFIEGEGDGKFAGTLGAIVGRTTSGVEIRVGGGFTNIERDEIWANQSKFLNRPFDVTAKARFESGSLRHPNFQRWRTDRES